MHELSIADAIVRIATGRAGERRVTRVEIKVGHLRQVVPDALEFAFGLVAEGTVAEGAELALAEIPVRVACTACATESPQTQFPLACPRCGSLDVDVVAGEELQVESLELEDEPIAVAGRR
jgi:hydrogenase nickel incorporation protein HypA/HybF